MKKRTILILLILVLSVYVLNINVQGAVEENNYRPTSIEMTPHDPITITSDSDFEVFPGTGTVDNPHIIEKYIITTTDSRGIYITGTTKYFIVRDCYVDAGVYGIYIRYVADGTATVIKNICSNNGYDGIYLYSSGSSTIANNTCGNSNCGIYLYSSGSSTIANNTCHHNKYGITIYSSDFCFVTYNLLQENDIYGIYLVYGSDNNLFHHNTFVDNNLGGTSQAYDDSTNNTWYDSFINEGNFWSDWSGIGSYSIDGFASSEDLYPLDEPDVHSVESTTDENPLNFTFTLLMVACPLFLTRTISKKTKKE